MDKLTMRTRVAEALGLQLGDIDDALVDERMDRIYQYDLVNQVPSLGEVGGMLRFAVNGAAEMTYEELEAVMSFARDPSSSIISDRRLKYLKRRHIYIDSANANTKGHVEHYTDKHDFYERFWDALPDPTTGAVTSQFSRIEGILVEGEHVSFWPRPAATIQLYSDALLYRAPIPSAGLSDRENAQRWCCIWGAVRGFASAQGQDEVGAEALARYNEFLAEVMQQHKGDPERRPNVGDRW